MARALAAMGVIAGLTAMYFSWLRVTNPTTVALSFLLIIHFVAASSRLWVAVIASVTAALAFDFFFLPPVGTFNIDDPQDWIAFFAFLTVSPSVEEIILHALARDDDRYRSAAAMRCELAAPELVPVTGRADRLKAPSTAAVTAM